MLRSARGACTHTLADTSLSQKQRILCVPVSRGVYAFVCLCVRGFVDGSWEADTVQENRPLATDLFGRWQFQGNSITMAVAS